MIFQWPLKSNQIRRGMINHTFGPVRDGGTRNHQGWDFYAVPGTPCFAVSNARVASIRTVGDYGNTVVLELLGRPEKWFVAYSHLSRIDVELGECVEMGHKVGLTGNTGNASTMKGLDQHLHFELRTTPTPGKGLGGRLSPIKLFGVCPLDKPIVQ